MNPTPLVSRELARLDIEAAFDYYLAEGGTDIAIAFVDEIERTFAVISRTPSAGSSRYAHELELPNLRFWPIKKFPYLIFYVDLGRHAEIWRVLHSHSDIPSWMRDPDSTP
jgi:toxin ParE1/3/4